MKLVAGVTLIFLSASARLWAGIGDTLDQFVAQYGPAQADREETRKKDHEQFSFEKDGIVIECVMNADRRCVMEVFHRRGPKISDQDIDARLAAEGGGYSWSYDKSTTRWIRSDGKAKAYRQPGHSDFVFVELLPGWEDHPDTAALVKTYRNSLVFVTGTNGSGSGFLAKYETGNFLFTNAHVAAGVKGASFKTLDGTQLKLGAASCAVGHDVFLIQAASSGEPFEIMKGVDENAAIGDQVVVLGNAEGAGVINTITGKIVGIGPNLVEVDAPFQPGNSGSPIVHLKSGKVIGVATYAVIRKYDPATKQPIKEPVVRRFGYRLDSIKSWQPVNWATFSAQAAEMETIEKLTTDLAAIIDDLTRNSHITHGAHNNPAFKNRIDDWLQDRSKRLSPHDAAMADQSFLSFLKITCQSDVAAARQNLTYDYFQRGLTDQQRERDEIAKVFDEIIQDLKQK